MSRNQAPTITSGNTTGVSFLLTRPDLFFSNLNSRQDTKTLVLICFLVGLEAAFLDSKVLATKGFSHTDALAMFKDQTSWGSVWSRSIFAAVFSGIGGLISATFWFYIRTILAGVKPKPAVRTSFSIVLWSQMVYVLPLLGHRVLQTLVYDSPALASLELEPHLYILCRCALEWMSIWAMYEGVKTVFEGNEKSTKRWFYSVPTFFWSITSLHALLSLS